MVKLLHCAKVRWVFLHSGPIKPPHWAFAILPLFATWRKYDPEEKRPVYPKYPNLRQIQCKESTIKLPTNYPPKHSLLHRFTKLDWCFECPIHLYAGIHFCTTAIWYAHCVVWKIIGFLPFLLISLGSELTEEKSSHWYCILVNPMSDVGIDFQVATFRRTFQRLVSTMLWYRERWERAKKGATTLLQQKKPEQSCYHHYSGFCSPKAE